MKFIAFLIEKTKNAELFRKKFVHLSVQFRRLLIETTSSVINSKKTSKTINKFKKFVQTAINISKIQMKSASKNIFQKMLFSSKLTFCSNIQFQQIQIFSDIQSHLV